MKRCPRCSELLWQRRFDGLTLDGCRSCGGTWIEHRKFDQILQRPELLIKAENSFRKGEQPPMSPQGTNLCPNCRKPLTPFRHPQIPSIALDSCPQCRGIWADEGELAKIHPLLQPAQQPSQLPLPTEDPTVTKDLPILRGYHLPEIRPTRDRFDQILRGLNFISSAFQLLRENPRFLVPILLHMAVSFVLFVLLALGIWTTSGFATGDELARRLENERVLPLIAVAIAVWYLATVVLGFFFTGAVVSMVDAYLKGRPTNLSIALKDSFKNADGLLALAFINILIGWLTSTMRSREGLSWLGRTIQTLAEVITYLVLPIIVIEDTGLIAAVRRGVELYRRHLLPITAGEVGVRLLSSIFNSVAFIGAIGVAIFLAPFGIFPLVGGALFAVVFASVVWSISAFVTTAYHTCLYLWAVEYERAIAPEQVTVPAPLASALV